MRTLQQWLIWSEGQQRFGLALAAVHRIVRMVEVTPVPDAPPGVLGVINVQGQVLPVVHPCRRLGLACGEASFNHQLILARSSGHQLALVAEAVHGLIECPAEETTPADSVLPNLKHLAGILRRPEGLVLLPAPEALLSVEERRQLTDAVVDVKTQ